MKNLILIFASFLLIGGSASAATITADHYDHNRWIRGYGNSFIFVEQGIEFAVFPDGQFDFNVFNYGPNFSAFANFGGVSISFNTGFDYNPFVQYDAFGAVIQIENVPIYYDYFGRIIQAGNVRIHYNNFGRIARIGGLFVHYNRFNVFSHYTGFINIYNRNYIFRPWHSYYVIPATNFCVVYNRPYRQFYNPIRHAYYRPYRNNARPRTAISYNRGRRSGVAQISSYRADRYRQNRDGRRDDLSNSARIDRQRPNRGDAVSMNSRPMIQDRGDRNGRVKPRTDAQARPMVQNRGDRNGRVKPRTEAQTRPMVSERGDRNGKVKPRTTMNSRPMVTSDKENKRRKVERKSTPKRSNKTIVSRENKRQTSTVSKRPKRSNKEVSRKSSNTYKSRANRSSSNNKRSATKRGRH